MKKEKKQKQVETEVTSVEPETQVNAEVELLKAQLARTLADYSNLQKRVERDRAEISKFLTIRFMSRFLPIFDMIEDAQKHLNDAGLGISLKVLSDTLKEEGIVEIEAKSGMMFDESLHEAIDSIETHEHENGEIAEVALKGYKFSEGPVIRHSKVKVYKNII